MQRDTTAYEKNSDLCNEKRLLRQPVGQEMEEGG